MINMKNKNKTNRVREAIKLFCLLIVAFGLLFGILFEKLTAYAVIQEKVSWWLTASCTLISAIFVSLYIITRKSFIQKMKTSTWIADHVDKILVWYAVPSMTLATIKNDITKTLTDLENMISISWTIFSLIVAVFLVWRVLVPEYLKRNTPSCEQNQLIDQSKRMQDRVMFHEKVSTYFVSVYLVMITLLGLLFATISVHMSTKGVTLFNYNATICSFYYCCSTILFLFIDICRLTKKDRDDLLEDVRVSNSEIEEQAKIEEDRHKAEDMLNVICDMENISESEKRHMAEKLREHYMLDNDII